MDAHGGYFLLFSRPLPVLMGQNFCLRRQNWSGLDERVAGIFLTRLSGYGGAFVPLVHDYDEAISR